jgi:hypothetical protein
MRFPEPVRMADDGEASPVWARTSKKRGGGVPIIGLLVTLLALFGALTAVLGIKEQSVGAGGAMIDGWISTGWNSALKLVGKAPEAADRAAEEAGEAADKTGEALQAGAATTAEELKKQ